MAIGDDKGSPGDLVFQDVQESNAVDDLSGKLLVPELIAGAKREELTDIYRRQVCVEVC